MTFVLAFDTATKTGVAFGRSGETPAAISITLAGTWPQRYAQLLKSTRALIEQQKPDIVAVEAFVPGPKSNPDLIGLVACVQGEAIRRGCAVETYYPATIRKHFLGGLKSKAPIKQQVFDRCRMLGWDPKDTDQSDACALWSYVCALHDRGHQMTDIGGLFVKVVR